MHSAVDAKSFFAWEVGWDHGNENPIFFWARNTGICIPLIFAAILNRGEGYLVPKRLLFFYLPFTLCFIVPNVLKMAPWIWDNIKVLYYWWLASAPLVALLLARLWRQSSIRKVSAVLLFACVTLAGALDVAGIAFRSVKYQVFDAADGKVVLAVGNDGQFAKFCEAAGCSLHQDPRFRKNADRVRHREVVVPLLEEIMRRRTVDQWVALLEPVGVPVGPINDLAQVFAHSQV